MDNILRKAGNMENALQTTTAATLTTAQAITETMYRQFIAFCDAKPQTIKAYTVALQNLFGYFRDHGITRPDTDDIIRYKGELEAQYKPCTVSLYMTAARLFFRWTAQRGYFPNIADHIKGARIDRNHKRDYLTAPQVKEVFSTADRDTLTGKRDFALLALMTAAGLRDIEVARANIEDLRPAGADMALYIQGKGRDEKADCVTIPAEVEKAIRDYLTARGETDPTAPLFVSASNHGKGDRLTTRSISRIVKGHFTRAGFTSDRLTAHSLRHTAITLSLLAGRTIQEAQTFARHADISTTQIYAHNIEDMTAKSACGRAVAAAIF